MSTMQKMKIREKTDRTSFVVMPKDLNYMGIIFGGAFMSQIDLAAATLVNRAIRISPNVDKAVTHKFHVEFSKPCFEGDIVTIKTEIEEVRRKAIRVKFKAYRESRTETNKVLVSAGYTVFVTMNENHYINHNLTLE